MRSSVLLSIPLLCFTISAFDISTVPIPGVNEFDTSCAAQAVLDTCISSTTAIATSCALTDYACLCQKNSDILTCFNNCPNDPRLAGVRATQAAYCANASAYPSSTTTVPINTISSPVANTPTSSAIMTYSSSTVSSTSYKSSTSTSTSATPTASEKSGGNKIYISHFALFVSLLVIIM